MTKEPNVHTIEVAKLLKIERKEVAAVMKRHGIEVTASFAYGRGRAQFYDRQKVEALAQKRLTAPTQATTVNDQIAELTAEIRDLKAMVSELLSTGKAAAAKHANGQAVRKQ